MIRINETSLIGLATRLSKSGRKYRPSKLCSDLQEACDGMQAAGIELHSIHAEASGECVGYGKFAGMDVMVRVSGVTRPELMIITAYTYRNGGREISKPLTRMISRHGKITVMENKTLDYLLDREKLWYTTQI